MKNLDAKKNTVDTGKFNFIKKLLLPFILQVLLISGTLSSFGAGKTTHPTGIEDSGAATNHEAIPFKDLIHFSSNTNRLSSSIASLTALDITNVSQTTLCAGTTISVDFSATGTLINSNQYSLELSSSSGDFSNPVSLGTIASNSLTGTISGLIPNNTAEGTGYLIRVVASNPQFTGSSYASAITIYAKPTSPGVSDISVCQYSTPTTLNAQADNGNSLLWYGTNSTGGTPSSTPNSYSTNTVGSTTFYVSQINNSTGCESTRAALRVTITAQPLPPVVSPASYCQNSTALPLVATAEVNHTLIWYGTNSTGGTGSFNAPIPQTLNIGNTTYYVSQSNNATGCESTRAALLVSVISQPVAPVASNVSYCVNAVTTQLTATALTGHTLLWYGTNSSGGTSSLTAPTPSSLTAGQTNYYVSQKNNTTQCESPRKAITVTINSLPGSPTVSNITYCQNATAVALTATALSNHTLLWYGTNASGGTSSLIAPTPSTTTAGSLAYYVSQLSNTSNCESPRSSIAVTVNAKPALPVINPIGYCKNSSAVPLTGTALSGHTLLWYGTNSTGGTSSLQAPTPTTTTTGITNYYVSQRNNSTLCESFRGTLPVTINDLPEVPVTLPVVFCLNSIPGNLTATPLPNHTLIWYGTNSSGGSGSATGPIPDVSQSGIFNYYVSQRNISTTCEGPRAALNVEVRQLPELPIVSDVTLCLNQQPTSLVVDPLTHHSILWYGTDSIGGTASTEASTPPTDISGSFNYYLAQYDSVSKCESERTFITVSVLALEKPSFTVEGLGSADVFLYSSADTGNQWYRNSRAIEGATEKSYKISLQGLYQVRIVQDGCSSELSDGFSILVTGLDQPLKNSAIVYPMPVKDILNIELADLDIRGKSEIHLTDMFGKTVDQKVITGPRGTLVVSTLASGVYILSVTNHLYRQNIRIIKE